MPKFHVLSDLHIDSYARRDLPVLDIPVTDCDAVLVAGDTANSDTGIRWLIQQAERLQKPMFVIMGNHDYFGENVQDFDKHIRNLTQDTGVTFLQKDSVDFMGIRLLGCTLWTDYRFEAKPDTLSQAYALMYDYRAIKAGNRLYTPEDSMTLHQEQRVWLLNQLEQAHGENIPTVVMTHHGISPQSVSQKYAQMPTNAAFLSDLSEWLEADFAPTLWVHGHTHEAFDYVQANTHVVVNPRAYPNEMSSTGIVFDSKKVVSVAA